MGLIIFFVIWTEIIFFNYNSLGVGGTIHQRVTSDRPVHQRKIEAAVYVIAAVAVEFNSCTTVVASGWVNGGPRAS